MSKKFFILFCFLPFLIFADVNSNVVSLTGVVTNRFIVSNVVKKNRWSRTAVMADKDNKPMDPSGQLVAYSDAAAGQYSADHIGEISEAAMSAVDASTAAINSVTNQIPENAVHIGISLPRQDMDNFSSLVISEGSDGTNDWQIVRFPFYLNVPPNRHVVYRFPGGTLSVPVRWDNPWSRTNLEHRCVFARPAAVQGFRATFKSRLHDILGGSKGFSFGNSVVRVDGHDSFTGAVTNKTTGAVLTFKSGVLQNAK